jgi:hypothetical protein
MTTVARLTNVARLRADVREKMDSNKKEILTGAAFVFYIHVAKQDGSRIV